MLNFFAKKSNFDLTLIHWIKYCDLMIYYIFYIKLFNTNNLIFKKMKIKTLSIMMVLLLGCANATGTDSQDKNGHGSHPLSSKAGASDDDTFRPVGDSSDDSDSKAYQAHDGRKAFYGKNGEDRPVFDEKSSASVTKKISTSPQKIASQKSTSKEITKEVAKSFFDRQNISLNATCDQIKQKYKQQSAANSKMKELSKKTGNLAATLFSKTQNVMDQGQIDMDFEVINAYKKCNN